MAKRTVASWEVSDAFWQRVEPLIPERQREARKDYVRKPGGGRKPKEARVVFEAVVYVLRTGCQWKALPRERFGSASAIHKRFQDWGRAGGIPAVVANRTGRIRRHGGHRMALAKCRWGDGESPAGAGVGRAQPHRPGKKMEASVCCWSTRVGPRCRSS